MTLDREMDAYADAILIAVLRYLVVRRLRGGASLDGQNPHDGVLTFEGIEGIEECIRQAEVLGPFSIATDEERAKRDAAYRSARSTIDPLWQYVEEYGIPALKAEIAERTHRQRES